MSSSSFLSVDFETASQADLKKTGARRYSEDPSTRVLCMAWAFDDDDVEIWTPGTPFPPVITRHVLAGGEVRGWNLEFEFWIWNNVLRLRQCAHEPFAVLKASQLNDTMARAAYWGLPMSLDMAGQALRLNVTKDKAGHTLMLQMCKPRTRVPTVTWWHETDPAKYDRLKDYCKTDVEVERTVGRSVPELPPEERATWALTFEMNARGVRVDTRLIGEMIRVADEAKIALNDEMADVTDGAVQSCSQTAKVLAFAQAHGYPGENLRGDTIKELLPAMPDGLGKKVIELRRDASRASTAKLMAMLNSLASNGRISGMLAYYGATRTGRWAGRLVQLQNLPRGVIKEPQVLQAIDMLMAGAQHDDLELLFPVSSLSVLASALRSCIVADKGKLIISADLSQIEARVVAWLAGQLDILQVFASGEDVYVYTAKRVGSNDRQLGKVLVLACGFGMGPDKFRDTAKTYGLRLSAEEAEDNVRGWREANPEIVQLWWDADEAARRIALGDKRTLRVGQWINLYRRGNSMIVVLPSGRELVYRNIRLERDPRTGRHSICYDGVDQKTRRWGTIRTYGGKLVENWTQATARDVMRDALLQMRDQEIDLTLSVHDEGLAEDEADKAAGTLAQMLTIMKQTPKWAPGLPVDAAGWFGPRYKKG